MIENTFLEERYQLAVERIREIPEELSGEQVLKDNWAAFFSELAGWIIKVDDFRTWMKTQEWKNRTLEEWKEFYEDIYEPVRGGYDQGFANPDYCARCFGKEYGQLLSFLASEVYRCFSDLMMGNRESVLILWEVYTEIYTMFVYDAQEQSLPKSEDIRSVIYWYVSDYSEEMTSWRMHEQFDPDFSPIKSIIMSEDLTDLRYLYRFGEYVSETELKMAQYLNSLSQEKIERMADTFVEGYIRGFAVNRISLTNKHYVTIRGSLGFERVFRSAVEKFRSHGLEPVFFPASTTILNRRQIRIGYQGKGANLQFEFDHCKDKALFYDRPLASRHLAALRKAYEECRTWVCENAGPACFETFGEDPFAPVMKENACHMSSKQQKLESEFSNLQAVLAEEFRKSSEISFTIIAFPTPDIGEDFEEIFEEIIKVNTLDNQTYQDIQQKIIDVLDKGRYVYIRGKAPNKTVMKVHLHLLADPEKQTLFENCCADVNIPVGEVFTSPKLSGTEGLLHATSVYLNGIHFKDLMLRFADGKIISYSCGNSEDEEHNKRLIKDYLMVGRDTLPIGEFAIGTNTTAYAAAEKYHMIERLPILIVEKTGPHFAIGDTCYSRAEEHPIYNPDGKEMIARENEISARRGEEGFNAYFNCHTDITIPYDEIGEIVVVDPDENMISIIRDGRFVLDGTESLNIPLNKD